MFLEFSNGDNWNDFKRKFEDYVLYTSPYTHGKYNQVCIALWRSRKFQVEKIIVENPCDINIPQFLQIDACINKRQISILGVRIKTQGESKKNQYSFVKKRIDSLSTVLCLGDFNCLYKNIKEYMGDKLDVYGEKDRCLFPYEQISILKILLIDYKWGNAENCEIAINIP